MSRGHRTFPIKSGSPHSNRWRTRNARVPIPHHSECAKKAVAFHGDDGIGGCSAARFKRPGPVANRRRRFREETRSAAPSAPASRESCFALQRLQEGDDVSSLLRGEVELEPCRLIPIDDLFKGRGRAIVEVGGVSRGGAVRFGGYPRGWSRVAWLGKLSVPISQRDSSTPPMIAAGSSCHSRL
jgi:hypothetical protein